MKKPLILIGGGGHCRSCIDVIEAEGSYAIEGILDTPDRIGKTLLGYSFIGDDTMIDSLVKKGYYFLVTLGQMNVASKKKDLFLSLRNRGAKMAIIQSPTSRVSKHASLGEGTIVMHSSCINAGATVGENVILNTGSLVEHDVTIESHVHVSTHAIINGGSSIKENCFLGSNSVVVQNVQINSGVVIGAGAVVTASIDKAGTYVGCPAKRIVDEK
jgi:sugar O-acyltransferase (sialic acid O-acetyltransferase NeuD family)